MDIKRQSARGRCDLDDLKEEYNAFMKTKTYMAKRILEQQEEIEKLKDMLLYQNVRNTQMYDMVKQVNSKLSRKEDINLSQDLINSIILDDKKENELESSGIEKSEDKSLKEENVQMRKHLELLKGELCMKDSIINKLVYDKFLLYSELAELVYAIKGIDPKTLNKLLGESNKKSYASFLGIKLNLLSAECQLAGSNSVDQFKGGEEGSIEFYKWILSKFEAELNNDKI
jgi:hypothetical protein